MKKDDQSKLTPKLRFPEFREAEGWDVDFLGGICQPQQWTTISSTDLVDEGYPVYGANGFIGYYTDFNHEFETVAVTCRGSTCGEVSLIPPKSYITGNSMCLDGIDAVQISYHFLYQLLKHRGFGDVISGSAQPQIVGNAIKRLRIALPTKPEQQKIAECLSSVDELIGAQARKVDALKTHKNGLMQLLFPREGETQPRLRFPEFQNAGEWEEEKLEDLCDRIMDGTHFSPKTKDGPRPYLTSKNVKDGRIDLSNLSYISEEEHLEIYKRCPVKLHDVLLTKDGANTGNCALNNLDFEFSLLSSVAVLRGKPRVLLQGFLFQSILSDRIQALISESMSGQAITRITLVKIGGFSIPVTSTAEQHRIAACLTSLDDLIAAQTQKLEALKLHKKGLMQQLFPAPTAQDHTSERQRPGFPSPEEVGA